MNLFKLSEADSTDFAKRAGFYQDEAIRNPVVVKKNGRPRTVLLDYDEFLRLRERDRQAYALADLPDEVARTILDARAPDDLPDGE